MIRGISKPNPYGIPLNNIGSGEDVMNPYFPASGAGDIASPYQQPPTVMSSPPPVSSPSPMASPAPPPQAFTPPGPLPIPQADDFFALAKAKRQALVDRMNTLLGQHTEALAEENKIPAPTTTKYEQPLPTYNPGTIPVPKYDTNAGAKSVGGLWKYLPLALFGGVPGLAAGLGFMKGRSDASQEAAKTKYGLDSTLYANDAKSRDADYARQMDAYGIGEKTNYQNNMAGIDAYKAQGANANKHSDNIRDAITATQNELNEHDKMVKDATIVASKGLSESIKGALWAVKNADSLNDPDATAKAVANYKALVVKKAQLTNTPYSQAESDGLAEAMASAQTESQQANMLQGYKIASQNNQSNNVLKQIDRKGEIQRELQKQRLDHNTIIEANKATLLTNIAHIQDAGRRYYADTRLTGDEYATKMRGLIAQMNHGEFIDRMKQQAIANGYRIAAGSDKYANTVINGYKDIAVNGTNNIAHLRSQKIQTAKLLKGRQDEIDASNKKFDDAIDKQQTAVDQAMTGLTGITKTLHDRYTQADTDPNQKKVLDMTVPPTVDMGPLRQAISEGAHFKYSPQKATQDKNPLSDRSAAAKRAAAASQALMDTLNKP